MTWRICATASSLPQGRPPPDRPRRRRHQVRHHRRGQQRHGLADAHVRGRGAALVETAHAYGRKVAVHAHGADGIKLALRAGADSIEHGTVMDDEIIRTDEEAGAYYVPTLSTVNGYLERLAKPIPTPMRPR
jgi:hypothetical protein